MAESKYSKIEPMNRDKAVAKAKEIIEVTGMTEWPQCSLLNNPNVRVQTPFVMQEEAEGDGEALMQTYIVPYGIEGDHDEHGTPLTRMCILLDAITGEFQEVAVFGKPVAYITSDTAIMVVASALRKLPNQLVGAVATPIFEPGEITNVRAYPFWKVVVDGRAYFVDQTGKLYGQLSPSKGGS